MFNNEFYVHEKYAHKMNGRCFVGGTIFGLGLALICPVVRVVHYAVNKAIRKDIREEIEAEKEEEVL